VLAFGKRSMDDSMVVVHLITFGLALADIHVRQMEGERNGTRFGRNVPRGLHKLESSQPI